MDKGIYAASSGGLLNARRLDVVANNLANVNTVGFKAERLISRQQDFADTLASTLPNLPARDKQNFEQTPGTVSVGSYTDFSPGPISNTGNPLNVALAEANTFFVVQTPTGEAYTRAGNFTLDKDRNLITADGLPVVGDGGPLTLPSGEARIAGNGNVIVNGAVAGKVRVAKIEDTTQLERLEGVRFRLKNGGQAGSVDSVQVVPESVEMPNVSVVDAMVDMINAQKGFEAYTKTVRSIDELNERVLRNARNM